MSTTTDEIVWLDGPTDPSFVIIRDSDDSQYFYWPIEISVPIRTNDTEPVKVNQNIVLSRYHFYGLTIWINPTHNSSMPVAYFAPNFHTPLIITNDDRIIKTENVSDPPLIDLKDRIVYTAARRLFKLNLELNYPTSNNPRHYQDKFVKEIGNPISQISYLFDANFIRNYTMELILIGKDDEVNNLLGHIRNLSPSRELTINNIINFFDFR